MRFLSQTGMASMLSNQDDMEKDKDKDKEMEKNDDEINAEQNDDDSGDVSDGKEEEKAANVEAEDDIMDNRLHVDSNEKKQHEMKFIVNKLVRLVNKHVILPLADVKTFKIEKLLFDINGSGMVMRSTLALLKLLVVNQIEPYTIEFLLFNKNKTKKGLDYLDRFKYLLNLTNYQKNYVLHLKSIDIPPSLKCKEKWQHIWKRSRQDRESIGAAVQVIDVLNAFCQKCWNKIIASKNINRDSGGSGSVEHKESEQIASVYFGHEEKDHASENGNENEAENQLTETQRKFISKLYEADILYAVLSLLNSVVKAKIWESVPTIFRFLRYLVVFDKSLLLYRLLQYKNKEFEGSGQLSSSPSKKRGNKRFLSPIEAKNARIVSMKGKIDQEGWCTQYLATLIAQILESKYVHFILYLFLFFISYFKF